MHGELVTRQIKGFLTEQSYSFDAGGFTREQLEYIQTVQNAPWYLRPFIDREWKQYRYHPNSSTTDESSYRENGFSKMDASGFAQTEGYKTKKKQDDAERWQTRREEIRAAMLEHFGPQRSIQPAKNPEQKFPHSQTQETENPFEFFGKPIRPGKGFSRNRLYQSLFIYEVDEDQQVIITGVKKPTNEDEELKLKRDLKKASILYEEQR